MAKTQTKKKTVTAVMKKPPVLKKDGPRPRTSRGRLQRESSATAPHEHRFDTLRIADDDGRIFNVCLECGERRYETVMEIVTVPVEKALEQKSLSLADRARAITITDLTTYTQAGSMVKDVVSIRKEITEHYAPLKKAAHDAHQLICAAENKFLSPVAEAERVLKQAIGYYDTEQTRLRNEQARKTQEADELRRQQEVQQAQAMASEKAATEIERLMLDEGMSYEEATEKVNPSARAVQAAATVPQARTVVAPAPKLQGVTTTPKFECSVDDVKELCGAIYRGEYTTECVVPNMPILNGLARLLKQSFKVPGCRLVEGSTVTVR